MGQRTQNKASQTSPAVAPGMPDRPTDKPPGVVMVRGQHGPQTALPAASGVDELRAALDLSVDVPVESLCRQAADVILTQQRLLKAGVQGED